MQNFSINSVLRFNGREYQFRTSNNGRLNKIVCALFRNGGFINSKEIEYNEDNETLLLDKIKKFHEQRKKELELYFNLSEKLKVKGNSELLNMLGLIFDNYKLHKEAIEEYIQASQQKADDSRSYNNMGKSLIALKMNDQAIKAFQKAIKINPNYVDFYNNLGIAYLKIGACKSAVQQFNLAINLNSYYAEAHFNKAMSYILNQIKHEDYELTNNYQEEVQNSLKKAVLMNPSYQNKYYVSGLEYFNANKPLEALEELKKAKTEGSSFSYLHEKYNYFLKILFSDDEDYRFEMVWEYIHFLKELIKKYPGHADIYNDLGLAYCMLRNYLSDEAITSFKNAIKINPQYKSAQRNLKLSHYEKKGSVIFLEALAFPKQNGEATSAKTQRKFVDESPNNPPELSEQGKFGDGQHEIAAEPDPKPDNDFTISDNILNSFNVEELDE